MVMEIEKGIQLGDVKMLRLMRLVPDLMKKGGKEHQDLPSDFYVGCTVKDGAFSMMGNMLKREENGFHLGHVETECLVGHQRRNGWMKYKDG